MPNPNLVWTRTVVEELVRSGLRHVCIAPGSRSTPLVFAFAEHAQMNAVTIHRHLDERSAAFFALGLVKATRDPVALVCTSGSALANFFPAVVEAHESGVPLIILTGDRPHELRGSGANQTIDQIEFYGKYALWSVDLPLPEADPDPLVLRCLRTTADRAYATANGIRKGVVHLNFPFRKPLEPTADDLRVATSRALQPAQVYTTRGTIEPQPGHVSQLVGIIEQHERGIIVCGTNCPNGVFPTAVNRLAQRSGYPIFADPLSGVRFEDDHMIGGYETFLKNTDLEPPDVVIRFGAVPTSKWLNDYLSSNAIQEYIQVSVDGVWSDDLHQTTMFIQADPVALCNAVTAHLPADERISAWSERIHALERATWDAIHNHLGDFDAAYVYDLIAALPDNAILFAGNSLPIRHVDQFGRPSDKPIMVYGNRGASGIDGNVSTALGIAAAHPDQPMFLLIGDVTLYHDMNGLLAVRNLSIDNITIVLLNNDGGGIFNRLPVSNLDPTFTDLFVMPHGLDFTHAARLYGLDYTLVENRAHFRDLIHQTPSSPRLIEIRTESRQDEAARRTLVRTIQEHIRTMQIPE